MASCAGTITNSGTSAGTLAAIGASTYSGKFTGGAKLNLTFVNNGGVTSVIGNASNALGGTLTVTAGTLQVNVPNGLNGTTGTALVLGTANGSNSATFDIDGTNQVLTTIATAFNSTVANQTITDSAAAATLTLTGTSSFGGVISGAGTHALSLTYNGGSNTLALSGTNTYTGTTTINGGTLQFATGGSINNAANIFINGASTPTLSITGGSVTTSTRWTSAAWRVNPAR